MLITIPLSPPASHTTHFSAGTRQADARFRTLRSLLRTPLYYKLLLPNLALLGFGLVVGAWLLGRNPSVAIRGMPLAIGVALAVGALVLGGAMNALILHAALAPIRALEKAAAEMERGNLSARAEPVASSDSSLSRLITVFNQVLDAEQSRREQKLEISARALKAEEIMRMKISRELYDDLAQTLAGVLITLRVAEQAHDSGEIADPYELLGGIRGEILGVLEGVRGVARRLHPPELDDLGLGPAIDAYARRIGEESGIRTCVTGQISDDAFSADTRLAAFRILQEATRNAALHAEASKIDIHLGSSDGFLNVEVVDDGHGFDAAKALTLPSPGYGLSSIMERAAHVGGVITVDSTPTHGTTVHVQLPSSGRQASTR